jgi:hypothetical protein
MMFATFLLVAAAWCAGLAVGRCLRPRQPTPWTPSDEALAQRIQVMTDAARAAGWRAALQMQRDLDTTLGHPKARQAVLDAMRQPPNGRDG